MRTLSVSAAVVCALMLWPVSVLADDGDAAAAPTLNCNMVALHILTDDLNAARLVCHVAGATSGDSSFSVSASAVDAAQPLCRDGLAGGEGTCLGGLVDPTTSLSVTATLQPSGQTIGPVLIGGVASAAPPEAPPVQYFPLGD